MDLPGHGPDLLLAALRGPAADDRGHQPAAASGPHDQQTGVGVSCLCPGWVATDIADSDRNIPEWAAPAALNEPNEDAELRRRWLKDVLASGAQPDDVADMVHDAVTNEKFWIFTDMTMVGILADKHDSIMNVRNPQGFALPGQ